MKLYILIPIIIFSVIVLSAAAIISFEYQEDLTVNEQLIAKTKEEIKLAERTISLKGDALRQLGDDYSRWDEMVSFASSADPVWARDNLEPGLDTYQIDYAWVYRPGLDLVYSSENSQAAGLAQFPEKNALEEKLVAGKFFNHFYVNTAGGFLEVRTAPIQPSDDIDRVSAPRGFWIVARQWDDSYLSSIADLSGGTADLVDPAPGIFFTPVFDINAGQATFRIDLLGINQSVVRQLEMTITYPFLSIVSQAKDRQLYFFATITGLILFLVIFSWFIVINRPLRKISASLQKNRADPLESLLRSRTEFGELAQLISRSFEQENKLRESLSLMRQNEERTAKLNQLIEQKSQNLEKFNQLMVGRELRMVELKAELERQRGSKQEALSAGSPVDDGSDWSQKFQQAVDLEESMIAKFRSTYLTEIDRSSLKPEKKTIARELLQKLVSESEGHKGKFEQLKQNNNG